MIMTARVFALLVLAGAMCLPAQLLAQAPSVDTGSPSAAQTAASQGPLPLDQIVTKTVHEAWVASGRNEDKFLAMVQQLMELSASKRGITLPETEEAGQRAGNWIKKEARRDPDQLLYVVVDRSVQYVGRKQAAATPPATPPTPSK